MEEKKINKGRRTRRRRTRRGKKNKMGGTRWRNKMEEEERARPFSKSGQNKKEKNPNSH